MQHEAQVRNEINFSNLGDTPVIGLFDSLDFKKSLLPRTILEIKLHSESFIRLPINFAYLLLI